jgi:hypothetical protein
MAGPGVQGTGKTVGCSPEHEALNPADCFCSPTLAGEILAAKVLRVS